MTDREFELFAQKDRACSESSARDNRLYELEERLALLEAASYAQRSEMGPSKLVLVAFITASSATLLAIYDLVKD